MKSKASYFSLSMPLIRENFRRFWTVPALSFLVYFLSGIFPILMAYSHINDLAYYIKMTLANQQPFFCLVHLIVPIIAAAVVLRYLQGSSSATYMNALPFSRAKLFNSNFIAGWLMCMLPILITAVILMLLSTPTFESIDIIDGETIFSDNVFTLGHVMHWFWKSVLVVSFIYMLSIFAGILTGSSVIQLLLSLTFCFLLPSLWLALNSYFSLYLWGYASNYAPTLSLFPWFKMIESAPFGAKLVVIYIVIALLLIVASAILNVRRKVEKAGDGVVFNFVIPVICYLIAFLGMSLFGFYFYALGEYSNAYMYAGMIAGSIIAYIIVRMLLYKSPRIFNKQTLKSFAAYAIAATLLTCTLVLDITGFENRIPANNKIAAASLDYNIEYYLDSTEYWRYDASSFGNGHCELNDPANIKIIQDYHRSLIDSKASYKAMDDWRIRISDDRIIYRLKNGKIMKRNYEVPLTHDSRDALMGAIYESAEFKDYYALSNVSTGKLKTINVSYLFGNYEMNLQKKDFTEFVEALDADFKDRTFTEHIDTDLYYAQVSILYSSNKQKNSTFEIMLNVRNSDERTIKWLEEHGFSQIREQAKNDINMVTVDHVVEIEEHYNGKGFMTTESREQIKSISDQSQIAYILEHGQMYLPVNTQEYYHITLQNSTDIAEYDSVDNSKYGLYSSRMERPMVTELYFTSETVPDFIK